MPLHFAAARTVTRSPIARALARRATGRAANDNGDADAVVAGKDRVLNAALRHFAEHGLGAAEAARAQALAALSRQDNISYEWWLDICRTLDRRMADRLVAAGQIVAMPTAV